MKRVIHIPKGWTITFTNADGEPITAKLHNNAEYHVTLKDGTETFCTFTGIRVHEDDESNTTFLQVGIKLNAGYMDTIVDAKGEEISVDDISAVERISTVYDRDTRTFKKNSGYPRPDTMPLVFAFDTSKFSTQYRITVYTGEFIACVVRNGSEKATLYGTIVDCNDDNNIIFDHYMTVSGVREVSRETIATEDILGIYRYALKIEAYDPDSVRARRERKAKRNNNPATETNAEESET